MMEMDPGTAADATKEATEDGAQPIKEGQRDVHDRRLRPCVGRPRSLPYRFQ